jgi:hypothetical protein
MSRREKDNNYDRIITRLGAGHRVIACADDSQWIVQEKKGKEWRSKHYCTSRDGVLRRVEGLPGWETLAALPERFASRQHDIRAVAQPQD